MQLALLLLQFVSTMGLVIKTIPQTNSPPNPMLGSSAVYDETTKNIYIVGGFVVENDSKNSDIYSFNLESKQWNRVSIGSEFTPSYLNFHHTYLKKSNGNDEIIVLSFNHEVFRFNLKTKGWSYDLLHGDLSESLSLPSYTSMNYNSTDYIVKFGGLGSELTNNLYLIEVDTLKSKLVYSGFGPPFPQMGSSINYYNGSLYVFGYSLIYNSIGIDSGNDLYRFDLEGGFWEVVEVKGTKPFGRIYHYSCIYKDELYIFYGLNFTSIMPFASMHKFNFIDKTWYFLSEIPYTSVLSGAYVHVNESIYFIFGRNTTNIKNSVVSLNLDETPPTRHLVSDDWVNPTERKHHCSLVIGTYMYIFGGILHRENEKRYLMNDMWTFNLEEKVWESVNCFGEIPAARSRVGCALTNSETFALFGGYSLETEFSDLFIFYEPLKMWYKLEPENSSPSKRYSTCLCYHDNTLYIIGGRNSERAFNEIWTYSFVSNSYNLTDLYLMYKSKDYGLFETNCWIESFNDSFVIFVAGGEDISHIPNEYLIMIKTYNNGTISIAAARLGSSADQSVVGSETSLIVTDKHLIRYGGVIFDYLVLTNIVIFNRSTFEYIKIGTFRGEWNFATNGHSLIHYKKLLYLYGGTYASEVFVTYSGMNRNMKEISIDKELPGNISCSPGTVGKDCSICKAGTYYHNKECKGCPPGKFSTKLASTGIESCTPCPNGFYSPKSGSKFCINCPSGFTCPIGSSYPKNSLSLPKNDSSQPEAFKTQRGNISAITQNLWYGFSTLAVFILILSVVIAKLRQILKKVDLFTAQHGNDLEKPVVYRKTTVGGVFSIAFIFFSIVSVVTSLLTYKLDNISETRTLIPVITLDKEIVSKDYETTAFFYLYGGECVDISNENSKVCSKYISVLTEGIDYYSKDIKCFAEDETCRIRIYFKEFKLVSKIAKIFFNLQESSSSANAIGLNLTSSSSIPNEKSSISVVIQPPSKDLIFKGLQPSTFYFKLTPSIFESESDDWKSEETGFHISEHQSHEQGSVSTYETLNIRIHLLVTIVLVESDTAMNIKRILNQSLLFFIGSLVGSVFGFMGTFAVIMSFTENLYDVYDAKKSGEKKLKKFKKNTKDIRIEFNLSPRKNRQNKVIPINDSMITTTQGIDKDHYI